jgi:hypothetical protein
MNIGLTVIFVIIIIIWAIIRNRSQNQRNIELTEDTEENGRENESIEIEELFFENIRNKEKRYKIMTINNQLDLMLIKSLFESEQLPYYIEGEHVFRLNRGVASVYILEKDYNDVITVVENYLNNKKNNYKEMTKIRKALEFIGENGIKIIYKND